MGRMIRKKGLKRYGFGLLVIILSCVIAESASRFGWLDVIENKYYDTWHRVAGPRYDPRDVAIAAIDDKTLLAYQDHPLVFWGPLYADALKTLRNAGARCIGVDMIFSVSVESWLQTLDLQDNAVSRTFDIPMREQLNTGDVILIGKFILTEDNKIDFLMPVNDYLFSLPGAFADIGLANLYPDRDEVVRNFVPMLFPEDTAPNLSFAALLVERAAIPGTPFASGAPVHEILPHPSAERPIGFAGPPGTFPRISFMDLLQAEADQDPAVQKLKNKIVIIAQEHGGDQDKHLTPYQRLMSGPEIHANIIETLLTDRYPKPVPHAVRLIWLLGATMFGTVIFFRYGPLRSLFILLALMPIFYWIGYGAFKLNHVLTVANVHLALLLSYVGSICLRLSREEQSRTRLQRVLEPYVSEAVVEKVLAGSHLPDLGGETLRVTVLFSDIRSFTTLSEKLAPDEVVDMLNNYYTRVCEPILEQGGMVDKFIGDAVMALFGAPLTLADQARRALIASVSMVDIAADFREWVKDRFPGRDLPEFRIGIGLHTGEAVIGNIGSPKKMAYTAIGDTVNVASRLESMCKKLGWTIVASRETAMEAGQDAAVGRSEMVTPTGRAENIEVVEILGMNLNPAGKEEHHEKN